MGSASFWLVLVVAACVIALIVVNAKRKSLEETSAPHDDHAYPPEPPPIKIEPQDDKVESIGSQVKLYGYRETKRYKVCPFCDGENSVGANDCVICGRDIR